MNNYALDSEYPGWKKRIALFLISQNISLFGSSVVGFAIIWHITLETSSGIWIMIFTICAILPQVLVSPFGGVWADRHNRKTLIMLSDGFIALATLVLAISFMSGLQHMGLLLAASVVRSIGAGIQTPTVIAMYPQLVPREQLTKVQGINQTLNSVLLLLSPAVGGVLLGSVGIVAAFFVDVVTATTAIAVLSLIRIENVSDAEKHGTMWADLKCGMGYTFRHAELRRTIVYFALFFFFTTPAAVLTPLMLERSFGSEVWRLTANEIVWTVGSLLGGVFVSLKGQFHNKVRTVSICLIAFGVMFGLLGAAWNFAAYLVFMGIAGFFMPVIATVQTVHIQEITEPAMLGRVFSIITIISSSAVPVAILLFGPLADVIDVETILLVTGLLLAAVGVLYQVSSRAPAKSETALMNE